MAVSFLVLAAVFPAVWHLWAERSAGNANHYFAVVLLFGFWQACSFRNLPNSLPAWHFMVISGGAAFCHF